MLCLVFKVLQNQVISLKLISTFNFLFLCNSKYRDFSSLCESKESFSKNEAVRLQTYKKNAHRWRKQFDNGAILLNALNRKRTLNVHTGNARCPKKSRFAF